MDLLPRVTWVFFMGFNLEGGQFEFYMNWRITVTSCIIIIGKQFLELGRSRMHV
jgi:hypothetical protein